VIGGRLLEPIEISHRFRSILRNMHLMNSVLWWLNRIRQLAGEIGADQVR